MEFAFPIKDQFPGGSIRPSGRLGLREPTGSWGCNPILRPRAQGRGRDDPDA